MQVHAQAKQITVVVADDSGKVALPLLRGQLDRLEIHLDGTMEKAYGVTAARAANRSSRSTHPPVDPYSQSDLVGRVGMEAWFYNRRTAHWDSVLEHWTAKAKVRSLTIGLPCPARLTARAGARGLTMRGRVALWDSMPRPRANRRRCRSRRPTAPRCR